MTQDYFFNSKTFQYLSEADMKEQVRVQEQLQKIVSLLEKKKVNKEAEHAMV